MRSRLAALFPDCSHEIFGMAFLKCKEQSRFRRHAPLPIVQGRDALATPGEAMGPEGLAPGLTCRRAWP